MTVALIVLGPEKLPQMTRQIGKAWGDFRRFREHLEGEVRGALGEDLVPPLTPPWQPDGSTDPGGASGGDGTTSGGALPDGAAVPEGSASGEGAQDRAPPGDAGHLAPPPPAIGSGRATTHRDWDPGLAPDDPSLN